MQFRFILTRLAVYGSLSAAIPSFAADSSQDVMLELFQILRDRGSISDKEYQKLTTLADKERESRAKETRVTATPSMANTSAIDAMDRMEKRLAQGEQRLAKIENAKSESKNNDLAAPNKDKWYEKLKIDGYSQFRYTGLLDNDARDLHVPADRSVDPDESFVLRRGRFKITGDITEHLYLYSQFDLAGSVFGSGGSLGLQARDLFADISFDAEKEYRVRVGQSKVPFGWVNMQSSQNRGPMERPDALNSAVEGERDLGIYFMYAPESVRERFKELVKSGLKGSGDYGMLALGAFSGQGLNRSDRNGEPHVLARLTYPWKFPNGQFFETSINAYHGKYVVGTSSISPGGVRIDPVSSDDGVTDQRVGVSAILYPQPFGLEAEWNWGRGPELSSDYRSIGVGSLHGGYVQANYRVKTGWGEMFPFARWHYYDGARKFANNAPRTKVNEVDFGLEWSPWPEIELSVMYTHTFQRTDTTSAPYRDVENADRLGLQVQWNY